MKQVLILGGSQRGSLGHHLAQRLTKEGFGPIIVGRSVGSTTVDHELPTAQFVTADLTHPDVAEEVFKAIGDCNQINLVVVSGGVFDNGPLVQCSPDKLRQLWYTNVIGPELVLRAFHEQKRGAYQLITIASTSATKARTDEPIYAATQAARRHFALSFHGQMVQADRDSRTLVVCPGGMRTNMYQSTTMKTENFMDPGVVADHIRHLARTQLNGSCLELRIERNPDGTPNLLPVTTHSV